MGMMLSKTYDAFRAAGAPDQTAREAAEEIAGFENRLATIEADGKVINAKLSMLQWMVGINIAATLAILWRVFAA